RFAELAKGITSAAAEYRSEVRSGVFPGAAHSFEDRTPAPLAKQAASEDRPHKLYSVPGGD
ncbi:MAG: hypothetical protein ACJ78Z_11950, partial [Myxococcales bacterium]